MEKDRKIERWERERKGDRETEENEREGESKIEIDR